MRRAVRLTVDALIVAGVLAGAFVASLFFLLSFALWYTTEGKI